MKERFRYHATGGLHVPARPAVRVRRRPDGPPAAVQRVEAERGRGRGQPAGRVGSAASRREARRQRLGAREHAGPPPARPEREPDRGSARRPQPARRLGTAARGVRRTRAGRRRQARRGRARPRGGRGRERRTPRRSRSSRAGPPAPGRRRARRRRHLVFVLMLGLVAFQAKIAQDQMKLDRTERELQRGRDPLRASCGCRWPSSRRPTAGHRTRPSASGCVRPAPERGRRT